VEWSRHSDKVPTSLFLPLSFLTASPSFPPQRNPPLPSSHPSPFFLIHALTPPTSYLPGPAGFIFSRFLSDKTVPQGAATTLYGCLDPAVPPGAYLKDCAVALPDAEARDEGGRLRQQLWTVTDQQVRKGMRG
jgi:hypothetical protein